MLCYLAERLARDWAISGGFVIRGVLLAFGILLVSLVFLPVFPISPFLGGYLGIRAASGDTGSAGRKALIFGLLLAGCFLVVAALATLGATNLFNAGNKLRLVAWLGVAIFTFYTASMSAMGALYAQLKRGQATP